MKEGLEKLQNVLKQAKLIKFKRDQSDYKEDKVYIWKQRHNYKAQAQRRRIVSFQLPSSDEDHSGIEDSSSTDFLDIRPKRDNRTRRRQGGRPDEAEAGPPRVTSYGLYTRSRTRRNK